MPGGRGSFSFHFVSAYYSWVVARWSELETANERINLEGEMCALCDVSGFLGKQEKHFYAVTKLTSSLQSQTSTYLFGAAAVYRKLFFIHHLFFLGRKIKHRFPFTFSFQTSLLTNNRKIIAKATLLVVIFSISLPR